jgi:hypothetical protein
MQIVLDLGPELLFERHGPQDHILGCLRHELCLTLDGDFHRGTRTVGPCAWKFKMRVML